VLIFAKDAKSIQLIKIFLPPEYNNEEKGLLCCAELFIFVKICFDAATQRTFRVCFCLAGTRTGKDVRSCVKSRRGTGSFFEMDEVLGGVPFSEKDSSSGTSRLGLLHKPEHTKVPHIK
jgi:hypothetical protein